MNKRKEKILLSGANINIKYLFKMFDYYFFNTQDIDVTTLKTNVIKEKHIIFSSSTHKACNTFF